jgi:hypothetical protein
MDPEDGSQVDADTQAVRSDYLGEIEAFRARYRQEAFQLGLDYVELDTSIPFDRALVHYLHSRQARF